MAAVLPLRAIVFVWWVAFYICLVFIGTFGLDLVRPRDTLYVCYFAREECWPICGLRVCSCEEVSNAVAHLARPKITAVSRSHHPVFTFTEDGVTGSKIYFIVIFNFVCRLLNLQLWSVRIFGIWPVRLTFLFNWVLGFWVVDVEGDMKVRKQGVGDDLCLYTVMGVVGAMLLCQGAVILLCHGRAFRVRQNAAAYRPLLP